MILREFVLQQLIVPLAVATAAGVAAGIIHGLINALGVLVGDAIKRRRQWGR